MAGGEGSRLHPLTANRCKPAVPFNGKHRIVDFVLSNLVNSEIYSTYLLVQYKSQSLIEHVRAVVDHGALHAAALHHRGAAADAPRPGLVPGHGRRGLPEHPPDREHAARHRGGVRRRPHLPHGRAADDRLPHRAATPTPAWPPCRWTCSECDQFGIVEIDDDHRIADFKEKPRTRPPDAGQPHARAGLDGQLHLQRRRAAARSCARCTRTARPTSASTSCRRW